MKKTGNKKEKSPKNVSLLEIFKALNRVDKHLADSDERFKNMDEKFERLGAFESDRFSSLEIGRMIESSKDELALIIGKGFNDVHKRIDEVENRLILTKEDLARKIDGTNLRIDDIASNKANAEYVDRVSKRVTVLESKIFGVKEKNVKPNL
ncbi:MAG: hypothetical protein WCT19_04050 [Candidatus Paceibacterota bacterium]